MSRFCPFITSKQTMAYLPTYLHTLRDPQKHSLDSGFMNHWRRWWQKTLSTWQPNLLFCVYSFGRRLKVDEAAWKCLSRSSSFHSGRGFASRREMKRVNIDKLTVYLFIDLFVCIDPESSNGAKGKHSCKYADWK